MPKNNKIRLKRKVGRPSKVFLMVEAMFQKMAEEQDAAISEAVRRNIIYGDAARITFDDEKGMQIKSISQEELIR